MADNAYAGEFALMSAAGHNTTCSQSEGGDLAGINVLFFLRVPTSMLSYSVLLNMVSDK